MALFNLSPLAWWRGGVFGGEAHHAVSSSGGVATTQNGEHSPNPGASRPRTTLLWRLSWWLDGKQGRSTGAVQNST